MTSRKYRLETRQEYLDKIYQYFAIVFSETNQLFYADMNISGIVAFCKLHGLTEDLEFANKEIEQLFNTQAK